METNPKSLQKQHRHKLQNTEYKLKREFVNSSKTHSLLNLEVVMNLEQNTCDLKHLHKTY